MRSKLLILIACEFSGVVRDSFSALGHDVYSCDLIPSETNGKHILGDVREILSYPWDIMIAFPPCTYMCSSVARWWKGREQEQRDALDFVRLLLCQKHIPKIALENPVGCISTQICKPSQTVEPYYFGDPYFKKTCLWLKGLPSLTPSQMLTTGRTRKIHRMSPSKDRSKERSRTPKGLAQAMAEQWGRK